MLQSLRDNLKGTVAVIIIAIFAVPMVLFGVERLFVGSLGGNDVASVDGTTITRTELVRAINVQRQRILSQSDIDPNSDFLQDENLRGPVLESLTRRAALLNAAANGGMAVSEEALWQEIVQQPQFQTDGAFDQQRFRQMVANMGYTPATYLEAMADGVILNQQSDGVVMSSFITGPEVEHIVALAQQERSFFRIAIPQSLVEDSVSVTADEVASYYEDNQDQFRLPERVAVNYLEVNLDELAERQDVSEADVRRQYEQEIAAFDSEPQYQISHILIEDDGDAAERLQQAQQALSEGREFSEVAQEYSDDLGTRESGGYLGTLMEDVFPEAFTEAVYNLEEGEVSAPVETDAGFHLIRVDEKQVAEVPTFDERREATISRLRRSMAEQRLAEIRERLDELTYSASDLERAASELGLEIRSTELFDRTSAQAGGLAQYPAVRQAAFSSEVLEEGHNSPILELPDNRLVVVRVTEHQPEQVQPLEVVEEQAREQLRDQKIAQELQERAAQLEDELVSGADPASVAEQYGYELSEHDSASRSEPGVDRAVLQRVFTLPRPANEEPVLAQLTLRNGDLAMVGLKDVQAGNVADMEDGQRAAMRSQLIQQMSNFEAASYEEAIVSRADIKTD